MKTNMTHVIAFHPDGTAHCLWTDALPLAELGKLEVRRASEIEFNNDSVMWEVKIDGKVVHSAPSRAACISWEVETLNAQL